MRIARAKFTDWLEQDSTIFHLLGKPGCGKSTLMKYLVDHPATTRRLQVWAADRQLIVSHFFFWKPGDRMQKSIEGLMRALLHSVLKQQPELIPQVFESQWTKTASTIMLPYTVELEAKEIENAFRKLISEAQVSDNQCFAFFVDGLDEFAPRGVKQSYRSLVHELSDWSDSRQRNIKICVSSREYPELEEPLRSHPRIRLQEVTSQDIQAYVDDFFSGNPNIQELALDKDYEQQLKRDLHGNCNGVFLWIALVLRNIEQGLINGDNLADLSARLLSLPNELEEMLMGMFNMIEASHLAYCIAMIRVVALLEEYNELEHGMLNLYFMWFLEATVSKRPLQDQLIIQDHNLQPDQKLRTVIRELQRLSKRIKWRCLGLLEITDGTEDDVAELRVHYWSSSAKIDKHFPKKSWRQLREEGSLYLFGSSVHLSHRSVADVLKSGKLRGLVADHTDTSTLIHHMWQSFLVYMTVAVEGKAPLLSPTHSRHRASSVGSELNGTLTALIAFSWFTEPENLQAADVSIYVYKADEIAARDPEWSGRVNPGTGGGSFEAFDVQFCLVSARFYECFDHWDAKTNSGLQGKSLWLLYDALWPRVDEYRMYRILDDMRFQQRAISTVRILLDHGLEVASPSLDEGLVCDYAVTRLVSDTAFDPSPISGNVNDLRDIVQALLLKGAVLSLWTIFSSEYYGSSEDTYTTKNSAPEHRAQGTRRAIKAQISAPAQVIAAYGVPVRLYTTLSRREMPWGPGLSQKSASDAPVELGKKYFLTDLFERSKLTLCPEAAEKLRAIEDRLQDELRHYEVVNASRGEYETEPDGY